MKQPSIKNLVISGLHDQLDVSLRFSPSLNIIFGKNGRGKTTILHVLANILERDFGRFRYLQFQQIVLETHQGDVLTLTSDTSGGGTVGRTVRVEVNGQETTPFTDVSSRLTEAEELLVAGVLGPRAVYLPAFRSILERVAEAPRFASETSVRQKEFERIVHTERLLSRGSSASHYRLSYPRRDEQSFATATKTLQCRQWFGEFVPVIRYPSLGDVRERLTAELRDAQFQMASVEQKVFSESFTRVFDAIAANEPIVLKKSTPELLRDVSAAVGRITAKHGDEDNDVYAKILAAVRRIRQDSDANQGTTNRVLSLYAELLERRSDEQERLFQKIDEFERSVNKFLDGKSLVVDSALNFGRYRGPVVSSGRGRPLNLSSLSSGERQVLTMIFCASRMGEDKGIFLVDEPELSLHIDWQRDILSEVMRQAGDRQVIACTHSPEVGADHAEAIQFFEPALSVGNSGDEEFSSEEELPDE